MHLPVRYPTGVWLLSSGCSIAPVAGVQLDHTVEVSQTLCVDTPPKVDVLIVVDGSPSMHGEASSVALEMSAIASVYEQASARLDSRIAVVSAEVGQPGCAVAPGAAGRFVDTSCRERLDDFVTGPTIEGGGADVRDAGCQRHCALDALDTVPSGPDQRSRPWVESKWGFTNLPEGVSLPDDLVCRGPQGVAACPFEAPLEAMRRALLRADDPEDPAFGFVRPDAALFVLFITDELDCSLGPDVEGLSALLDPDGPRTYWSDTDGERASSGFCWGAGVECSDRSDGRDCWSADRPVPGGASAVLRPVERYAEQLRAIAASKRQVVGDQQMVFVLVVGGVGPGGTASYPDVADAEWLASFGVGPGCAAPPVAAAPPVRLAEIAEEFAEPNGQLENGMLSICEPSWSRALACLPGGTTQRWCVDGCFADADPTTDALEADCTIEWTDPSGATHGLRACEVTEEGFVVPVGEPGCGQLRLAANEENVESCRDALFAFRVREGRPRGCFRFRCAADPTGETCRGWR